jgi:hypothetical protein
MSENEGKGKEKKKSDNDLPDDFVTVQRAERIDFGILCPVCKRFFSLETHIIHISRNIVS